MLGVSSKKIGLETIMTVFRYGLLETLTINISAVLIKIIVYIFNRYMYLSYGRIHVDTPPCRFV